MRVARARSRLTRCLGMSHPTLSGRVGGVVGRKLVAVRKGQIRVLGGTTLRGFVWWGYNTTWAFNFVLHRAYRGIVPVWLPFYRGRFQVSVRQCPPPILPALVVTTFRCVRHLYTARREVSNERFCIFRRQRVSLVVSFQARKLLRIQRFGHDDRVIVVRLRVRFIQHAGAAASATIRWAQYVAIRG